MSDYISLKETLDLCISRGMTRRQAKRWLMRQLREGNVHAQAVVTTTGPQGEHISSGRHEELPEEFWQMPFKDSDGDIL